MFWSIPASLFLDILRKRTKEKKVSKKAEKSGAFAEIKVGLQQVFKDCISPHSCFHQL